MNVLGRDHVEQTLGQRARLEDAFVRASLVELLDVVVEGDGPSPLRTPFQSWSTGLDLNDQRCDDEDADLAVVFGFEGGLKLQLEQRAC